MAEEPLDHVLRDREMAGELLARRQPAAQVERWGRSGPVRAPAPPAAALGLMQGDRRQPAAGAVAGDGDALRIESQRPGLVRQPCKRRNGVLPPRRGRGARARADSRATTRSLACRGTGCGTICRGDLDVAENAAAAMHEQDRRFAGAAAHRRGGYRRNRMRPCGAGTSARSLASPMCGGGDLGLGERAGDIPPRASSGKESTVGWRRRRMPSTAALLFRGRAAN